MREKALDMVVGLDHEKLMKEDRVEALLKQVEKYYQKESRVYKLTKLKEFYNIRRDSEESMEE